MSLGSHHLVVTKYNRNLQRTPGKRIAERDKVWLKYLQGKVGYGERVFDRKTPEARRKIRQKLRNDLIRGHVFRLFMTALTICLLLFLINYLGVL